MIYDKISKQFINMNPNQIGSETDRFIVLDESQIQRANEMISAGQFNEDYMLTGEVTAPTLEQLKEAKLNDLIANYTSNVSDGYYDEITGITLSKTDKDIMLFSQDVNGVRLLILDNNKPDTITIFDINDVPKTILTDNYISLMTRYYLHNRGLFELLKGKTLAVQSARDETELNEIDITI